MALLYRYICCFLLLLSFFSCKDEKAMNRPLVAVGEHILWKEQLIEALPKGLSEYDSLQYAEHYIHNWIVDILIYQQALKNIRDMKGIDQKVEDYKKSLILQTYLNELAAERVPSVVPEAEIKTYYEKNDAGLRLTESIIKGFILKIPANANDLQTLKELCMDEARETSTETLDAIEKYCVGKASIYEYFYDRWEPLNRILETIPIPSIENEPEFLANNSFVEFQDSTSYYFLNIKDYLTINDKPPYEFSRKQINDILSNQKRITFIKEIENDLYNEAVQGEKIKRYD